MSLLNPTYNFSLGEKKSKSGNGSSVTQKFYPSGKLSIIGKIEDEGLYDTSNQLARLAELRHLKNDNGKNSSNSAEAG